MKKLVFYGLVSGLLYDLCCIIANVLSLLFGNFSFIDLFVDIIIFVVLFYIVRFWYYGFGINHDFKKDSLIEEAKRESISRRWNNRYTENYADGYYRDKKISSVYRIDGNVVTTANNGIEYGPVIFDDDEISRLKSMSKKTNSYDYIRELDKKHKI